MGKEAGGEPAGETAMAVQEAASAESEDAPRRIEAALRDMIGRVEQVRAVLEDGTTPADAQELLALLDTKDGRLALGLGAAEPLADEASAP